MSRPLHTHCSPLSAVAAFSALLLFTPTLSPAQESNVIDNGSTVSIEYTLTIDDGSTIDSNVGAEPLVYTAGAEQILPALDQALRGMIAGDSRTVTLAPQQGYGAVDPSLMLEVELELPVSEVDASLGVPEREVARLPRRVRPHEGHHGGHHQEHAARDLGRDELAQGSRGGELGGGSAGEGGHGGPIRRATDADQTSRRARFRS